jgi:hypothetical protein
MIQFRSLDLQAILEEQPSALAVVPRAEVVRLGSSSPGVGSLGVRLAAAAPLANTRGSNAS